MSDTINNGGPAFPVTLFEGQTLGDGTANGMTLRDYFAAKAMQGMLAAAEGYSNDELAGYAYIVADAMLRARESA